MPEEPSFPWRALLGGEEEARTAAIVLAVARDLAAPLPAPPPGGGLPLAHRAAPSSVASGEAGHAVFYAYLDQYRPGEGFDESAAEHLGRAVELLSSSDVPPSFYQGFTGVAWAVDHLRRHFSWLEVDEEDPNTEIDEALLGYLDASPWPGEYDLTGGLAGYAVYALPRLPKPSAAECLERIVDRLAEIAVERDGGITWHTPAERLQGEAREFFAAGQENLGVAHGIPGLIAVLARITAAGIAVAKARPLLDGAVAWLLAQKLEDGASIFPTAVGPGVDVRYSRAAWCYGDPGVAATLLMAARAVGEPDWEREALGLARFAARRPEETTGVRDGCLCHGAAGLAHLFNRMYQATGEEELREAALAWLGHVLGQNRPGQGVGGFLAWGRVESGELAWNPDPTLLTGAAGVGLALIAAVAPYEPRWDELLLIAPTPPGDGET